MRPRKVIIVAALSSLLGPIGYMHRRVKSEGNSPVKFRLTQRQDPFQPITVKLFRDRFEVEIAKLGLPDGLDIRYLHKGHLAQGEFRTFTQQWNRLVVKYPSPYEPELDFDVAVSSGEQYRCLLRARSNGEMQNFLFRDSLVASIVRRALVIGVQNRGLGRDWQPYFEHPRLKNAPQ